MKALEYVMSWDTTMTVGMLKITHQKYRNDNFYKGKSTFEASNGIKLESSIVPEVDKKHDRVYVRGYATDKDDVVLLILDGLFYTRVLCALDEYNDMVDKGNRKPFEEVRERVVVHLTGELEELEGMRREFLTKVKNCADINELMLYKKRMLIALVNRIPLGVLSCPFCIETNKNCSICEYGKKYGMCKCDDSTYGKINKAREEFGKALENYWR